MSFVVVHHRQSPGTFSRDITTNLAPQFRAFSRALAIGKLKAKLFPNTECVGDTKYWCIRHQKAKTLTGQPRDA